MSSTAELEALVRGVLCLVNTKINAEGLTLAELRPSLRALAAHHDFVSMASMSDPDKVWGRRISVTCLDSSDERVALPVFPANSSSHPQPPLDGHTLRPGHFERIASVYGLALTDFVADREKLNLVKFSNARNDIVHGNVELTAVFSKKGFDINSIRDDVEAIEQIGYRTVITFDRYLMSKSFRAILQISAA